MPGSAPRRVVDSVRVRRLEAAASWELAQELVRVLRRPKFRRYGVEEDDLVEIVLLLAPLLPGVEVDVAIRDPKDSPVVAAAVASGAEAIVTGDRDLLEDESLRRWLADHGVEVLTPAALGLSEEA